MTYTTYIHVNVYNVHVYIHINVDLAVDHVPYNFESEGNSGCGGDGIVGEGDRTVVPRACVEKRSTTCELSYESSLSIAVSFGSRVTGRVHKF